MLDRALDLAPAERGPWLEDLDREDADLARDLRALLAHEPAVETERFLDSGSGSAAYRAAIASAGTGRTLGAYSLETLLGEGGMGSVWLARRSDGSYEGKVAIKLVRTGLNSSRVLARFESERQTLARMNHSNIARVFDAGTSGDGRPFFVMEYVPGQPLTDYCEERRLTVPERLALFLDVCAGAQHAHRNGIIHRDLKPSNILVCEEEGRPVPKVIDFGIAKATEESVTGPAHMTLDGELIGTPAYMSPEQRGESTAPVDIRSDVYTLGIVLYELLVGALPRDPSSEPGRIGAPGFPGFPADAPTPAARLSSLEAARGRIAASRRTDPAGLARLLSGDLSWILMKAIDPDPDRRYETVAALSQDIRAFLADEPVQAGPPGAGYRARKFVRRHRAGVAAAVAVWLSNSKPFGSKSRFSGKTVSTSPPRASSSRSRWATRIAGRRLSSRSPGPSPY